MVFSLAAGPSRHLLAHTVAQTQSRWQLTRAALFTPHHAAEHRKLIRLSGHEHKCDDVRCAQFGLWQGARREHIPQWICNRRATQPQAKFGATLRAAVLFRPDFVARSLQIHCGICSSLTPRLAEKSLAANAIVFMFMTT